MHLLKSSLMSGITMCGHIHIMVTRLRSKPGQESAIIKTQVLQKCLTTTHRIIWRLRLIDFSLCPSYTIYP